MSARHCSFALSRPGLKAGHYVPARLRIVDTLTVVSGVPMVIALVAIVMTSLRWANQLGFGVIWRSPLAFFAFVIVVLLVAGWTVSLTGIAVLRVAFRVTGMLQSDEAHYYPLRADKRRVDPWPEIWQKPEFDLSKHSGNEASDSRETSAQSI